MTETITDAAVATDRKDSVDMTEDPKLRSILPLLGFALIFGFFAIATRGKLVLPENLSLILNSTYVLLVMSIGVFMIMTMGSLDFSQGSMAGLACIVVCQLSHTNPVLAILGGIATGAAVGAINAYFHVRRQIPSFIVTICMMFLVRGIVSYLTTEAPIDGELYLLDFAPFLLPITVACLVVFYLVFTYTPLGATLRAIGAGQTAARFAGIDVARTKTLVYIAAGAITGFASFLLACRNLSVTASGGTMFESQIMLALVLGGLPISGGAKVRFSNIVVGVLTYYVLEKGLVMLGLQTDMKQLVMGAVFLVFLAIFSDRESNQVIK